MGIYPALHPIVYKLAGLFRSKSGLAQEFNANFTQQVIRERKASLQDKTDGPPDLLSKFLQAHSERPDYFTDYNIYASCLQNIVAGSDTTSITLSAILYYLCKDERVYANLLEEVESMNPTTFQAAQKMPYLQAVIKEAMRMHPATGLPLWRIVPKGGAEIAGRFFPEGVSSRIRSPNSKSVLVSDFTKRRLWASTAGLPTGIEISLATTPTHSVRNAGLKPPHRSYLLWIAITCRSV